MKHADVARMLADATGDATGDGAADLGDDAGVVGAALLAATADR